MNAEPNPLPLSLDGFDPLAILAMRDLSQDAVQHWALTSLLAIGLEAVSLRRKLEGLTDEIQQAYMTAAVEAGRQAYADTKRAWADISAIEVKILDTDEDGNRVSATKTIGQVLAEARAVMPEDHAPVPRRTPDR